MIGLKLKIGNQISQVKGAGDWKVVDRVPSRRFNDALRLV